MSLYARLRGIVGNLLQLGGPTGPQWKNNAGAVEARDAGDAAFVVVRGAAPGGPNDLVPLGSLPPSPSATAIFFDVASALVGFAGTPTSNAGNFTQATCFYVSYAATITGVRFYWKAPAGNPPLIVRCKVWLVGPATTLAQVDVPVTTSGFYTGTFGAAYVVPQAQWNQELAASMWETTGAAYTTTAAITAGSMALPGAPFAVANGVTCWAGPSADIRQPYSAQGVGDATPGNNLPAFFTCPVAPILQ